MSIRWALIGIMSLRLYAIDSAAGHMVEALPERDFGHEVYLKHCQRCHHADLVGVPAAPLDSTHFHHKTVKVMIPKLQQGCSSNPRRPYPSLKVWQMVKVIRYLQRGKTK